MNKAEKQAALDELIAKAQADGKLASIQAQANAADSAGMMEDTLILPPEPTAAMFYGLVGKVAHTAAKNTEVNPVAAATAFMSFLAANMGRDAFFHIANSIHHPRLFTMHIGRSGRGRKGDSQQITLRVRQRIAELEPKLLGQLHTGGLSSREGLASLIQDAHGDRNGTDDKRLWVIESEFSNVLHQTKRDGNTLSSSLRDAWDGGDIKPAVKQGKTWVSAPHVGIHANITPSELKALLTSREMHNGFANRFLFIWSESAVEVAFPKPTPTQVIDALAHSSIDVLRFAKGNYPDRQNGQEISLSAAARDCYADIYPKVRRPLASEFVTSLLERRAPYLLRLAMLFALTDQSRVIEPCHIQAALAWVNYATQSVRFIFQDQDKSASDDETRRNAEKIVTYLESYPRGCTATTLANDCFKKHLSADKFNKALAHLLTDIPRRIERVEIKGNRGRPATLYKNIVADKCGLSGLIKTIKKQQVTEFI